MCVCKTMEIMDEKSYKNVPKFGKIYLKNSNYANKINKSVEVVWRCNSITMPIFIIILLIIAEILSEDRGP